VEIISCVIVKVLKLYRQSPCTSSIEFSILKIKYLSKDYLAGLSASSMPRIGDVIKSGCGMTILIYSIVNIFFV
jgi:hypothetical protein